MFTMFPIEDYILNTADFFLNVTCIYARTKL